MGKVIPFPRKADIPMVKEINFGCCDHCFDESANLLHTDMPIDVHTVPCLEVGCIDGKVPTNGSVF